MRWSWFLILGLVVWGGWWSFSNRIKGNVEQGKIAVLSTGDELTVDDLDQGCLGGKDCIPSIDSPVFESVEESSKWLKDGDRVFGVDYMGVQRAYAQRVMNWHEIVNDEISGEPVAITFCPLCGSAVGFKRMVNGQESEFGVSGKLHNSDLVMYDRLTDSYWQQITGEAIIGKAKGQVLEQIPIITTTWGEWKKARPETEVLSRETGFKRDYDQYPYGAYEENGELYFGVENLDKSMQIKTVVYGVEINGVAKAYKEEDIENLIKIEDEVSGAEINLERMESGKVRVTRLDTSEEIVPIRLFWFAWAAFHPETEVYKIIEGPAS